MGFSLCPQPLNSSFIHHRFRPSIPLGFYRTKVSCRAMQQGEETENAGKVPVPHVLTVAGSDSGAGAGIQADLKACAARGVYCSTVVTAVTAQNTVGVQGVNIITEDSVRLQLKSVLSDMHPDVVKTGMLPSPRIVKILCESLKEFQEALVVDPVMVSTSGDVLAGPLILSSLRMSLTAMAKHYLCSHLVIPKGKEDLLPLADVVTPNLREASVLLGCAPLKTIADMRFAAKSIHDFGPRSSFLKRMKNAISVAIELKHATLSSVQLYSSDPNWFKSPVLNVLVKGGDLPASSDAVDVLFDGQEFHEFRSARIRTSNTHGTGCTLASSIAAELARGYSVFSAIKVAKRYIESALDYSKDILIGGGRQGPLDHLLKLKNNALPHAGRLFDPNDLLLYAVTDSRMNKNWGRPMSDAVKAAVEGGATIVQLRIICLLNSIACSYMAHCIALSDFTENWQLILQILSIKISASNDKHCQPLILNSSLPQHKKSLLLSCREKDLETGDFLEASMTCLRICRAHNVPFLINDRVDIALACGADGVHIGQSDMPARVARALLGPDKIIGVSCKTPEQAERAWADGADYIGCGGVYPTKTKENNVSVGLDGLRKVCLGSKLPVVAIGGIGVSNVGSVVGPGLPNLRGVAVVSAIFDRECVSSEARNLMKVILDSMDGAKYRGFVLLCMWNSDSLLVSIFFVFSLQ
ncbi:thiamine-phosphate pyrophosphorylase [Striga asiatica]|uniref:thiamine phosphate synthase n=1 Tax=Striga asiatica TaxID=4170 RepID=A0A5A7P210_STRAF|nr:thiamine-phosphate pyrophosphorylase [Striga asiatica]